MEQLCCCLEQDDDAAALGDGGGGGIFRLFLPVLGFSRTGSDILPFLLTPCIHYPFFSNRKYCVYRVKNRENILERERLTFSILAFCFGGGGGTDRRFILTVPGFVDIVSVWYFIIIYMEKGKEKKERREYRDRTAL